jgi:hypothetical protein
VACRPPGALLRQWCHSAGALLAINLVVGLVLAANWGDLLGWLPPADGRLMVSARVAVPVSLRYVSATEIAACEGDAILR